MAKRKQPTVHGVVIVDKPAGVTSHDVVGALRRIYGERRIGHGGTLDPAATGVLVVGVGWATRLLNYFQHDTKRYTGTVTFGTATDTLDAEGQVTETISDAPYEASAVTSVLSRFTGPINQTPPMVSAIRVDGERLYEKARRGEVVERDARPVTIHRLEMIDFFDGPPPRAILDVTCSAGTYIRVLAADIGEALGGCAHLSALRRTEASGFGLDRALDLDQIQSDPSSALLSAEEAVQHMETVEVSPELAVRLRHGQRLPLDSVGAVGGVCAVLMEGEFVGMAEPKGSVLAPLMIWPST
ncbi:MAG: tRNA pseudouridine(55) synthase TruB [Acidimicrobiia bacterium]|nr:tRNA pseudouridine(55) synthase TruB [Acidimicrobiia bacterium]